MLDKLAYIGHNLVHVDFDVVMDEPQGDGYYTHKIDIDEMFALQEIRDNVHQIIFTVTAYTEGFKASEVEEPETEETDNIESDNDEKVYSLKAQFRIVFRCEEEIEPETIDSNEWYFRNHAHIAAKIIVESILSHSALLRDTYIPPFRTDLGKLGD
jgi:hypothetical protein